MSKLKLVNNIYGWFDVKVYNDRQPRENWKLKAESDNIAFTATFDAASPEAAQFAAHGKPYTDKSGNDRVRVTFKISGRCRWYDEDAQQVEKPCNSDLDGKLYEVCIQYNELDGDPANPKSPRGYWANAIQFREAETNPFNAMGTPTIGFSAPPQPLSAEIPPAFGNPDTDALPY